MRTARLPKENRSLILLLPFLCLCLMLTQHQALAKEQADLHIAVERMKKNPRGPFEKIQWFCNDGVRLPPGEGACREHGGGKQYGAWNAVTLEMRRQGYLVANVLAATNPEDFTGPQAKLDELRQILFERFLIGIDDGWVFRRARYYRGAMQDEDEQHAAREMVLAMLSDHHWLAAERFVLLRECVRLLPISVRPLAWVDIRQMATEIAEKDPGFRELRFKLHSLPDAKDAERVRAYAMTSKLEEMQQAYERLALALEGLYTPQATVRQLQQLADESRNSAFRKGIAETIRNLGQAGDAAEVVAIAAARAEQWRKRLLSKNGYTVYNRLRLLRASLILEGEIYAQSSMMLGAIEEASRRTRLHWLGHLVAALHAGGLLSDRQRQAAQGELARLDRNESLPVSEYQAGLRYLERVSQWAQRTLEFHFSTTVNRWSVLTPLAHYFVPDRLRSSPLLAYSRVLDTLIADANRLSGIRHMVFGEEVGSGLRALNPGLRRGVLLSPPESGQFRPDGIYILRSTERELPPVAGIITSGEGSSLSHVQLLARNMGIPNLVVDDALIAAIIPHLGEKIVMAVSQGGVVMIEKDSAAWDAVFRQEHDESINIDADLAKIDLGEQKLKPLSALRAVDSGRIVGPKAANLGELMHFYPQAVNPGLVIPFGVFRSYLEQPLLPGGSSTFAWMRSEYARLVTIEDGDEQSHQTKLFLARLRQRILEIDLGEAFMERLRQALAESFGEEGSYGLFVRSDTNIEDQANFSGAGLNLTVANAVGFEAITSAILQVWASPFSDRSYAWRQAHMTKPEHVYPSVLLMKSFPSEKSGVLVTADVDDGDRAWLSIAANEGIGGAVEGQAAEELRLRRTSGEVRLLAQASSPQQAALGEGGGVVKLPASGRERILTGEEIERLRHLADDVESRFPLPKGADGRPVTADIEFGFSHGQLALFQIRPFVESKRAWHSQTLMAMDRRLSQVSNLSVELDKLPLAGEWLP